MAKLKTLATLLKDDQVYGMIQIQENSIFRIPLFRLRKIMVHVHDTS